MRKLFVVIAAFFFIAACSGEKQETAEPAQGQTEQAESLTDQDVYQQAAVELVGRFSANLRSELMRAMGDSAGAAGAIRVCRLVAPQIADSHSVNGWRIRRVTDKPRNVANLISTEQADILATFADPAQAPAFIEEWTGSGEAQTYHFYAPIRTAALCLNCHGQVDRLASGVVAALDSLYPDDQAVGYETDQLRGMFVVEGAYPQGMDAARLLVSVRDTL